MEQIRYYTKIINIIILVCPWICIHTSLWDHYLLIFLLFHLSRLTFLKRLFFFLVLVPLIFQLQPISTFFYSSIVAVHCSIVLEDSHVMTFVVIRTWCIKVSLPLKLLSHVVWNVQQRLSHFPFCMFERTIGNLSTITTTTQPQLITTRHLNFSQIIEPSNIANRLSGQLPSFYRGKVVLEIWLVFQDHSYLL